MDPDGGPAGAVHPRFDLVADPMPFGAIPWPDDLYLGPDGRIDVGALPSEETALVPEYLESLRQTLADLDGFGTVGPAFFTFDGDIDPASLPQAPAASLREDASVFLLDVDPGSPTAFERVPVRMDWEPSLRQLAVRPDDGHPLAEGRRYAVVLTDGVRAADGSPVAADPDFAAVRDAVSRPTDALLGEAHDQYAPVLASLESQGVERARVVALAVFRVQTVTRDLLDARARVWEREPPAVSVDEVVPSGEDLDAVLGTPAEDLPGLDVPGGVQHASIGWMIHGRYDTPWMVSDTANVHGSFRRESDGRLRIGATDSVTFTLFLPRSDDLASLRVVVYQHGLGAERSQALSVADALTGAGYAVLAIDAPFHGLRTAGAAADTTNAFTGEEVPDGFGDRTGSAVVADFAGIADVRGELEAFHPVYLRDTLRQTVVDLLVLVRVVRNSSSWDAVRAADAALASFGFSEQPLLVVGYSLGGMIGTMLTAVEPEVGAAVLAVTGGHITRLLVESPPFNRGYVPDLWPLLGLDAGEIDYETYHPVYQPEVAIVQTLLDRGDAINYARALRTRAVDLFLLMAKDDETLHNVATESLARAIGAPMVAAEPAHTDLDTSTAPVRDNVMIEGDTFTRALYVHEPATHGLMLTRRGLQRYAHPVEPPFEEVTARDVANPIDGALAQTLHFFESFRTGAAEVAAPPPE